MHCYDASTDLCFACLESMPFVTKQVKITSRPNTVKVIEKLVYLNQLQYANSARQYVRWQQSFSFFIFRVLYRSSPVNRGRYLWLK